MAYIYILPVDVDSTSWIGTLEKKIHRTFGAYTRVIKTDINLEKTFDLKRLQYNSSQILLQIIDRIPHDASKIVGIVDVDLFIPILTFLFGEAQLNGPGSIVSLHRLDNRFYGIHEDTRLLEERLIKEVIHELGHNFGILHCGNMECVMRSSTYVEDIDFKSQDFCNDCREKLKKMRSTQSGIVLP